VVICFLIGESVNGAQAVSGAGTAAHAEARQPRMTVTAEMALFIA
jgi:hypothetical protein